MLKLTEFALSSKQEDLRPNSPETTEIRRLQKFEFAQPAIAWQSADLKIKTIYPLQRYHLPIIRLKCTDGIHHLALKSITAPAA